jgi:cold-inducible RNA-binding protein
MATRLFVGNINHNATENDLQGHFTGAGTVIAVNIIQDKFTGKSRGFGFVEMSSQEEAAKAISTFNQKEFQGHPLTVNEARPREERPSYSSSRGYGGGGGAGGYRGNGRDGRREYRR